MNIKSVTIILLILGIFLTGVGMGVWFANGERIEIQVTSGPAMTVTDYAGTVAVKTITLTWTPNTKEVELPANTGNQAIGIGIGIMGVGMTLTGLILLAKKD